MTGGGRGAGGVASETRHVLRGKGESIRSGWGWRFGRRKHRRPGQVFVVI